MIDTLFFGGIAAILRFPALPMMGVVILSIRQEQEQIGRRIHAAASAMTAVTMGITDWDDGVVYQMLEKVTVLSGNRIKVTFRNGVEIEQTVDQPKRRKFI